jgi:Putative phage tail protein
VSFLSHKPPISATPQQLNSINVDRSRYGDPVPLVYGMQRIPVTLLWYGAFTSIPQSTKSGGKGGGGNQVSSYSYTASCVMGLCEGPITAIQALWKDKSITSPAAEGLVAFLGAGGQATWSYLTTNFPSQAVPYDHTAYLAAQNLALGNTAAIPNYTAEVQGFFSTPGTSITFTGALAVGATSGTLTASQPNGVFDITFSSKETRSCTIAGGVNVTWDSAFGLTLAATASAVLGGWDADPSAVWLDYCTDGNHGCNFNGTNTSVLQGAGNTYQTYCKANSLVISPWEDTQRAASSFLSDILELTNSDCVMSVGQLNVYPYCDVAVSGNGVTYTPTLTPLFAFTDDDYLVGSAGSGGSSQSDDPVQMTRKPLTATYNVVTIEFYDRANNYNAALAEWKDDLDIAINGIRKMGVKTFHQITTSTVALQVASLIGQRQLYVRNQYAFAVRADLYTLLEPMDLISITESALGLANKLCRVIQIDDDENDIFTITCEEMLIGTASAPKYTIQTAQGYYANYAVAPPSVFAPVIFSAPPALVSGGGGYELWLAVCGTVPTTNYGGCNVYASLDDVTWTFAGTMTGESRIGTVTTAHAIGPTDTTIFLTLYPDTVQLDSSSSSDFAGNRALMWLDGEIIGFNVVTLLSAQNYSVTVSRGLFGTTAVSHSVGASFAQLDATVFHMPFDPGMIGQTIHFKFYSFNTVGQQTQTSATDYSYVISNYGTGQLIGGPLTLVSTSGVAINGTSAYRSSATTGNWDASAYSLQGYNNGAFASWRPTDNNENVAFGLAQTPATGVSYTSIDYCILVDGSNQIAIEELSVFVGLFGTYAPGDKLLVSYDGAFIRYLQNGTLLYQRPAPANLVLYFKCSMFTLGNSVTDIQFGPYGTATPVLYIARGNCLVSDENVTKQGGSAAWDSDVYSINRFQTCHVVFKVNNLTTEFIVGISQVVGASPGFATVDFGFLFTGGGAVDIFEGGTNVGTFGTVPALTDFYAITYDGTTVTYWQNGASLRTVAISGKTYFLTSGFFSAGGGVNNLEFGPGSLIPLGDTAQLGLNAATSTSITTAAGPTTVPTSYTTMLSQTIGPFPVATTLVITCGAQYDCTRPGAGGIGVFLMTEGIGTSPGGGLNKTYFKSNPTLAAGTSTDGQFTDEQTFSLAANTSVTYDFYVLGNYAAPDTATLSNMTMKVEVIKR